MLKKIFVLSFVFFFSFCSLSLAKNLSSNKRNQIINDSLDLFSSPKNIKNDGLKNWYLEFQGPENLQKADISLSQSSFKERNRSEIIERTLEETIVTVKTGYMFVRGEQSFRLDHPVVDGNLSKLTYPIRGGMGFIDAEAKITPKFFVGGRYAASNFSEETSKDEDWNFWADHNGKETFINYQITEQNTKNKAHFWNANLYYRAYDWGSADMGKDMQAMFMADKLYLDVFAGYQYYQGRHTAVDPMTKYKRLIGSQWWHVPSVPLYLGLNSWYEVTYQGPRIGLRFGGSRDEKFSSSISLAYAWLKTDAHAYWNLRDFRWTHKGKGSGSALNLDMEAEYHITPHWFLGGGLHYMWQRQEKSLYSGTQTIPEYFSFTDLDLARDTTLNLFGFSLKAGFQW